MPKILILGSKGFIGSHLLDYLEKKGFDVLGCAEDIRILSAIAPYFKGTDFVIHAAGEVKKIKDEGLCRSTNVVGTWNVVNFCLENKCKMIHLSSTAKRMAYGRSKQISQQDVLDSAEKRGLKAVILRLCPIVKMDDPLMKWGRRYPLEHLMMDIEGIILNHNFDKCQVIDYSEIKKSKYEESADLHKS